MLYKNAATKMRPVAAAILLADEVEVVGVAVGVVVVGALGAEGVEEGAEVGTLTGAATGAAHTALTKVMGLQTGAAGAAGARGGETGVVQVVQFTSLQLFET